MIGWQSQATCCGIKPMLHHWCFRVMRYIVTPVLLVNMSTLACVFFLTMVYLVRSTVMWDIAHMNRGSGSPWVKISRNVGSKKSMNKINAYLTEKKMLLLLDGFHQSATRCLDGPSRECCHMGPLCWSQLWAGWALRSSCSHVKCSESLGPSLFITDLQPCSPPWGKMGGGRAL